MCFFFLFVDSPPPPYTQFAMERLKPEGKIHFLCTCHKFTSMLWINKY